MQRELLLRGDETMSLVWAEKDTIGIFPSTGFQVAFSMAEGAAQKKNVIFGGRLAEYKYYDMAPIVEKVLSMGI